MLTHTDLKKGVRFIYENQPWEVLEAQLLKMAQRRPVIQSKIKNLTTGKILERNFHQNETFEEAEIEKQPIRYLYNHRGEYWFCEKDNPAKRFSLKEEIVGTGGKFLKANTEVTANKMGDKIINLQLPIKMDLKIKEAPPGERGDTATGGTKKAILETGAEVNVPLFVNTDDVIRINTETGEYVERVEKA